MRKTLSTRTTRLAVLASGAVLTLSLAACGSDDSTVAAPPAAAGGSSSDVSAVDAAHNEADIAFINDMYPHHESAVAMAELADERASNAQVKNLAARIVAAQGPELAQLEAFGQAWDVDLAEGGGHSGMSMGGMSMADDAATLEPLTGAEFDRTFLELMIPHHEGALPMAQAQLDDGENAQASELAEEIIAAQTDEIAEMQTLLETL